MARFKIYFGNRPGASPLYLRPDADVTDGGWTNELGGTTLYTSINETPLSDSDYIQSSVNPTADITRISLSNPSTTVEGPVKLRYRYRRDATKTADLTVRLMQGASTIAEWAHTDISTSFVTATQTLNTSQLSTIDDFSDLFIELEADS